MPSNTTGFPRNDEVVKYLPRAKRPDVRFVVHADPRGRVRLSARGTPAALDDALLHELTFAGARTRWGELDARQTAQLEFEESRFNPELNRWRYHFDNLTSFVATSDSVGPSAPGTGPGRRA